MSGARHALVTGAARGLGRGVARLLADRGWTVLVGCRRLDAGEKFCAELRESGAEAHPIELDVADPDGIIRAAAAVADMTGRLDALVNNAGVYEDEEFESLTPECATRTMMTNAVGPLLLTRALLGPLSAAAGAAVVNVTSDLADADFVDDGTFTAYRMSKAALNMMTANLAVALAPHGIVVNAADPDWIPTDMGGADAPHSIEDAAAVVAWAAGLRPGDGITATVFQAPLTEPPRGRCLLPEAVYPL
jgi:NAD(P)-dependent dehydrogenase (short-subunit alcohol dehydrogenase family)